MPPPSIPPSVLTAAGISAAGGMLNLSGTTALRPIPGTGVYFDTLLGKPIFWNETNSEWVDATGTATATVYEGLIASRLQPPRGGVLGTAKQFMSRAHHFARDSITPATLAKFGFANWYPTGSNSGELSPGAATTITASVEYPAGVFTQILFSGSATGTIADGATLISDAVSITIPNGAAFWVRSYCTNPNGVPYATGGNLAIFGECAEFAASGITDKTMSGTISTAQVNAHIRPILIIGQTRKPSLLLIGDSRVSGQTDVLDASGDLGELARTIGPLYAYLNLGAPGEHAQMYIDHHAKRAALQAYISHVADDYGINDITGGTVTGPQLVTRTQAIAAIFPTKEYFRTTLAPRVTLTDGSTTAGGQTPFSGEAARVSFNTSVRAGLSGVVRHFDVADATETSRNSGLWKAGYTNDGVHENQLGALAIQASGVVETAYIQR